MLGARCDGSPDALAPTLAGLASSSLGDSTINDYEAYGLFRQVVGRFDARCGDETEISIAVLAETLGQVPRLLALRR